MHDELDPKYLDPGKNPFIKPAAGDVDDDNSISDGRAPFFNPDVVDVAALTQILEKISAGRNEFEIAGKKIMKMAAGNFQVGGVNLADLGLADLAALSHSLLEL